MTSVQYSTNKCGPDLRFHRDISRKELVEICEEISVKFTDHFNRHIITDASSAFGVPRIYKFEPEPITEGGLVMVSGCLGYKSFRIVMLNWPTIYPSTYNEWKNDPTILCKNGFQTGTYLKSYNTTAWTKKELHLIREVFALHDIRWKRSDP